MHSNELITVKSSVVYDDLTTAQAILDLATRDLEFLKELLHTVVTVIDYSGRVIIGTVYQIALGAENEKMAKMIQEYMLKLPEGVAEIKRQQDVQFPKGWEEEEKKCWESAFAQFYAVMAAIERAPQDSLNGIRTQIYRNNPPKPKPWVVTVPLNILLFLPSIDNHESVREAETMFALREALQAFIDELQKIAEILITQGRHFNLTFLVTALKEYYNYERFKRFGGFNSVKNNLLWLVIGQIQRYLPASYVRCLYGKNENPCGSFNLRHEPKISYFPLDVNPENRLGINCAAANGYFCDTQDISIYRFSADPDRHESTRIEAIYNVNTKALAELMRRAGCQESNKLQQISFFNSEKSKSKRKRKGNNDDNDDINNSKKPCIGKDTSK